MLVQVLILRTWKTKPEVNHSLLRPAAITAAPKIIAMFVYKCSTFWLSKV